MDPRVKTSPQDLDKQFSLELKLTQTLRQANQAVEDIHAAAQNGKITAEDEKKLAGRALLVGAKQNQKAASHLRLRWSSAI